MTDTDWRTDDNGGSTDAPHWTEVQRAFAAALEVAPEARGEYAISCSTDPAVRDAVLRLLERHASLEGSAADFLAPLDRTRTALLLAELEQSPAQIGRYVVQRVLGRGTFGTVYLAHDPELRRDVAVKLLAGHLGNDGPWVERFVAEARAASQLAHPHIVTVHDIGRAADGRLFIVMGYEGGGTLRDRLIDGPIDIQTAIHYVAEVADGLASAHSAGLVHRDIKPENLLAAPRGVRITDFGIAKAAKAAEETATQPGAVLGTAAYMSPEQSRGHEVDARADIWSIGVVLFELLTGTRPFTGATVADTLDAIRASTPPAPSSRRPEVPISLDTIVLACLAKDPAARYPSAEALRDALQAVAHELSNGSSPLGPLRLGARETLTLARNKRIARSLVFTLATIGVLGTGWLLTRRADASATASPGVLLVLPMEALDSVATGTGLAPTITASLRTQLASTPGLRVVSPQNAVAAGRMGASPAATGARIGATAVLTSTVTLRDSLLSIEASLVRSGRGDTLWRTRLNRRVAELAGAEQEIVESVAAALGTTARPWRQPDPVAYELFLRGTRALDPWNDSTLETASFYFREAIARDSNFARAWLGLAGTFTALQATPPAERYRLAKPLVARALAAEPNLAAAHQQAGWIALWYDHDWEGAERHFLRALELDPSDVWIYHQYSALLGATGRPDSSLAMTRRAMPLDPDAAATTTHLAIWLYHRGRYDAAIAMLEELVSRDTSWPRAYSVLGRNYLAVGRNDEALSLLQRDVPPYAGLDARGLHAHALGVTGETKQARALVAAMVDDARVRDIGATNLVIGYLGLGDTARALDWLEKVPDERGHMLFLLTESVYDPLRGSPRWRRVIDRLGLSAADTVRRAPTP